MALSSYALPSVGPLDISSGKYDSSSLGANSGLQNVGQDALQAYGQFKQRILANNPNVGTAADYYNELAKVMSITDPAKALEIRAQAAKSQAMQDSQQAGQTIPQQLVGAGLSQLPWGGDQANATNLVTAGSTVGTNYLQNLKNQADAASQVLALKKAQGVQGAGLVDAMSYAQQTQNAYLNATKSVGMGNMTTNPGMNSGAPAQTTQTQPQAQPAAKQVNWANFDPSAATPKQVQFHDLVFNNDGTLKPLNAATLATLANYSDVQNDPAQYAIDLQSQAAKANADKASELQAQLDLANAKHLKKNVVTQSDAATHSAVVSSAQAVSQAAKSAIDTPAHETGLDTYSGAIRGKGAETLQAIDEYGKQYIPGWGAKYVSMAPKQLIPLVTGYIPQGVGAPTYKDWLSSQYNTAYQATKQKFIPTGNAAVDSTAQSYLASGYSSTAVKPTVSKPAPSITSKKGTKMVQDLNGNWVKQ